MEQSVAKPSFVRHFGGFGRALPVAVLTIYALCSVATGLAMLGRLAAYDAIGEQPLLMAGLLMLGLGILVLPILAGWILQWADRIWGLAAMGIIFMTVVVAPRYKIEASSDQGDCIIVAARRLGAGLWPYDPASLWSHNPFSCGPGWVFLHMPVLAIFSYPLTMLVLLGLSFAVAARFAGGRRVCRFMVLLALVPGFWQCIGNRVDFPTFAVVLAALTAVQQSRVLPSAFVRVLASSVMVLVSHFRFPFLFIPTILLAGSAHRRLATAAIVQAISLSLWFAFYVYDSESFTRDGPMHVVRKFTSLNQPEISVILLVFVFFIITYVTMNVSKYVSPDCILLFYMASIVLPISAQNIFEGSLKYGWSLALIQNWEGLSWLTGSACYAAWILSAQEFPAVLHRRGVSVKRRYT